MLSLLKVHFLSVNLDVIGVIIAVKYTFQFWKIVLFMASFIKTNDSNINKYFKLMLTWSLGKYY